MNGNAYTAGLVSVSFRKWEPLDILKEMKRLGLTAVEWGSDVHAPCTDSARLAEIAALQAEYGVCCVSYGTYFRLGETPMSELPQYIAAAKVLGAPILRLWCGSKSGADMNEQERETLLSLCIEAAGIAEREGVILALECHKRTFTQIPEDAVWLMEQVSSPHFRMYWQPFQWQTVAENIENAKKIAPYATHIHVFNWKGEDMLPLSLAVEEWQTYLAAFSAPRMLLLEFMPKGTLGELEAEAAALNDIIGGLK